MGFRVKVGRDMSAVGSSDAQIVSIKIIKQLSDQMPSAQLLSSEKRCGLSVGVADSLRSLRCP